MPAQIKLGNTPDIQTVGAVNAGTAIVPDASNSLFLADGSNRVAATSEFYSGPTQPLGNVKMWFDTTTGQLKVNDGKSWTVQKGHVQAKDHGSFDPGPAVYTGFVQRFKKTGHESTYDELSTTVHLTRGSGGWLYNSLQDSESDDHTPSGTEWAFAGINGNPENISASDYESLTFASFPIATDHMAVRLQYVPAVCHLIAEDIYFDIRIAAWFGCDPFSINDSLIILERAAIPGSAIGLPIPKTVTVTISVDNPGVGVKELYINSVLYTPGTYQLAPGAYEIICTNQEPTETITLKHFVNTELRKVANMIDGTDSLRLDARIAEDSTITYGSY